MCGLAGALVFHGGPFQITPEYLGRMRDSMVHRGPDGCGTWVAADGRVGLAHRRLAIIDLSEAAAQPMANEDGSLQVAFNGEIYNHAEIRQELEELGGHRWRTDHSDTEVILHAFEQWGIECLDRFRGMFAFALWEARERRLWLVRDRIGIKPLYYSIHHGRITFASEIKALLEDPEQPREIDEEALYHYLSFLTTPAPMTLFHGIRKIPGGCWLCVSEDGTSREARYWDAWDHADPLPRISEGEAARQVAYTLREAVKLRKVSDVPVGVFLSGGIDSSTNAALFSEGEETPVRTFTIGYEGEYGSYRNETEYARRAAQFLGAEHRELFLTVEDLISFLPQMVWLQDEPIADPVCVPVYYVSKLARDTGVVVCQVGEGADELFCGYPGWKQSLSLQRADDLPVPRLLKRLGLGGLRALGREATVEYEWLRRGSLGQPVFWGGAEAFPEAAKRRLLSEDWRHRFRGFTSWEALRPIRKRFEAGAWERSHLHWMTYLDLNLRLPELLLMRVDKMSMGVGLEARVPFLDHRLVELALSLPATLKVRNDNLKHVLKKAVRGIIPDELIDRPKQGFGVPVLEWFLGRLGDEARVEIDRFCRETNVLDPAAVENLRQQGRGPELWYVLNLALWWKQHLH